MKIHFILVKPAVPEHVGAIARAIKTMGFHSLEILDSNVHKDEKARWLAHGSTEILDNVNTRTSFKEVVEEFDFVIGTTSKSRKVNYDFYSCNRLPDLLAGKENTIKNVALVFGSEKHGLENAVLEQCDIVSFIPMKSDYPSLNLSQAVMVYAYILSNMAKPDNKKVNQNNKQSYKLLKEKVDLLLDMTDIKMNTNLYNRINERVAVLQDDDIHLLHSICNTIIDRLLNHSA